MYFNKVNKANLDTLIVDGKNIYAHTVDERKETLEEHSELAIGYLYKIVEEKKLDNVFLNFENKLLGDISENSKILYREMILNTIYLHDLGKINCNFQYKKMGNNLFKNKKGLRFNNSNHSMLSSLLYLNYFFNKIQEVSQKKDQGKLAMFMLLNSYVISKHHGRFDSFEEYKHKLLDDDGEGRKLYTEEVGIYNAVYKEPVMFEKEKSLLGRIFASVERSLNNMKVYSSESYIYLYIYERLLSSLLLSCDYYATSHFKNQKEIKYFGGIKDIDEFYDIFKNTKIYKSIHKYEQESYGKIKDFSQIGNINILRNELFLEAEENLLKNIEKNIYYLEAPTGSGKSNVGFNLSFKLSEKFPKLNKIFYVYPFNTLIDQNIETLEKTFKDSTAIENMAVVNSLVPIKTEKTKYNEDSDVMEDEYEISLLNRQFLHYPMILTTHVSLFNYLFGTSKDNLFPLYQIANSIIILDEVQSYKNSIWKEIITFLQCYSEVLNIKIIIMSATLPNLNKLVDYEFETVNLIEDREKYYSNPIFKNRVSLDFSLLDLEENVLEGLMQHIIHTATNTDGNILVEFISKKTAMKFFKKLKIRNEESNSEPKRDVELITGDDNSIERNAIISKIKNKKGTILVATQVIEAGVDIDMDIGYKDISLLDSEEQFMGRINRSCLKNDSKVYFFNCDSASNIYINDVRKEKSITLVSEDMREILTNKDFSTFYDYVLKELNKRAKKINDENFESFINNDVKFLNFTNVEERMKLIDERYEYSVFLNREIRLDDNNILNGEQVWSQYIDLLKNNDMGYSEKKIKMSRVNKYMNYFIYKVRSDDFTYGERIGDIYYIDDGEKYFINGKFDRESFDKGINDFI